MEVARRLKLATELCEERSDDAGNLPDAAAVAAECNSWGVMAQLKSHQAEGVSWLIRHYVRGVNVILGDEMGLGKTLQSIVLLTYLKSQKSCPGPFLILSPLSVTDGWASELDRFAPKLTVLRYVGDKQRRETFRKNICDHVNKQPRAVRSDPALTFDVLLTTYELAILDIKFLSNFRWRYCIIDEAQRLKNSATVLYQNLLEQYMIPRRLLLTGTPIQNNLSELWSLLHFCMPEVFENQSDFLVAFGPAAEAIQGAFGGSSEVSPDEPGSSGAEDSKERLRLLRQILRNFMLRRTKAALVKANALSLPPLVEVTVFAPLVPLQKKVYISVLKKETPKTTAGRYGGMSGQALQNMAIQLRKACSHPYLFDGVEPEPFEEGEHLVEASGKLLMLDLMLKRLHAEGHRVLVFAQMIRTLDIIQDYLQYRGYSYDRLDGSVRAEERFAAVRNFSGAKKGSTGGEAYACEETFVFLLTTRAGGVGLNLVAADTVIFYEQDWNPQADKQALQRAHRIGQIRPVLAVNLITKNTIEEVILQRARKKLQLTHEVIGRDDTDLDKSGLAGYDNKEMQAMVVFGLHKIVAQHASDSSEELDSKFPDHEMRTIVDGALNQRTTAPIVGVKNEDATRGPVSTLEGVSNFSAQQHLDHLLKDEDAIKSDVDVDLSALMLLAESNEKEANDTREETGGRRGGKLTTPVVDLEAVATKRRKIEEKKQAKWTTMGYKSLSVSEPEDSNQMWSTEDKDYIHHFVGDCTKPCRKNSDNAVILWCVDDSGVWGKGGVFDALALLSDSIPAAYQDAHSAGDVHVGDVHLIPIPPTGGRPSQEDGDESNLWVALAVVQTYDGRRKFPRSEISLPHLDLCLKKIAAAASRCSASVHMPRIQVGSSSGRQGWYMVERLLRKYATIFDAHFNVYYYNRNSV